LVDVSAGTSAPATPTLCYEKFGFGSPSGRMMPAGPILMEFVLAAIVLAGIVAAWWS